MITKIDDFIKRVESTAEEDFFTPRTFYHLSSSMFHEMCELLKEQEAVEPTFKQDTDGIFIWACGSCGAYMYHIYEGIDKAKEYAKYCRQCGRKVKWK